MIDLPLMLNASQSIHGSTFELQNTWYNTGFIASGIGSMIVRNPRLSPLWVDAITSIRGMEKLGEDIGKG